MNIIDPKSLKIIHGLPPVARKGDKISIDSEFFGQTKSRLHRPHGQFAWLGCSFDGETVYYITDEIQIQEFFDRLDAGVWILHNAKYDFTQLRQFANIPSRKLLWDCMLVEQIMWSGYYNDFRLVDLARRYLDVYMSKEIREEFADTESITQEQIEYAAVDVAATWRVYQAQRAIIDENDLHIWTDIERDFLWELLDVDGIPMDRQAWIDLYTKNKADALEIQKKYMLNPEILDEMNLEEAKRKKKFQGINLGSWQQVQDELKKQKIHVKSTQEDDLTPYKGRNQFVDDVLEFRGRSKLASTYGSGWIENSYIENDNKVYSDFYQIGAATGRLSSSSPNVENIPVRETPEFRKCFISDDDYVLVDADWSSQEPRIFAYLSQDEKLIQIFKDHKDVYIESARWMFGWNLDKKDPRRKERMKPTVLGASYGLTEFGMEKKYGVPRTEGKNLLDTFFRVFDGAKEYKDRMQRASGYVQTIYGRKYWLNPYKKGSDNNALNSPVQGSGGDGMKIASVEFMLRVRECGYFGDIRILNFIHDEILVKCCPALLDWTVKNLRDVMIQTAEDMHEGIPADVEISHGRTWHEAHS